MMLCLALRSDPARVYQRALRQFSVDEISEAFSPHGQRPPAAWRCPPSCAACSASGAAICTPSSSGCCLSRPGPSRSSGGPSGGSGCGCRRAVARSGCPEHRCGVQRLARRRPGHQDVLEHRQSGCDAALEPLWLQAQSVPSAALVSCVRALPTGWTVASVAVNNGRSVLTLDNDRAGIGAVEVRLTAACDPAGASEAPSAPPGVHRYQRIERTTTAYSATWSTSRGGLVTIGRAL